MFLGFLIAVGVVVGLTVLGAFVSRKAPGTSWQQNEDHPYIGGDHH